LTIPRKQEKCHHKLPWYATPPPVPQSHWFLYRFKVIGLQKLTQLELFFLSHNELESLPEDLKDLASLRGFDVRNNPRLLEHAKFYEGQELEELNGWLEEFKSGSEKQDIIKVMLVGEGTLSHTPAYTHTNNKFSPRSLSLLSLSLSLSLLSLSLSSLSLSLSLSLLSLSFIASRVSLSFLSLLFPLSLSISSPALKLTFSNRLQGKQEKPPL